MQQILYSGQIKEADEAAVSRLGIPSPVLMERAALLIADTVCELFPDKGSVLVASGSGNNGGDGFAAARLLCQRGWRAEVFFAGDSDKMSGDCGLERTIWENMGGKVLTVFPDTDRYDVIIDALFGTGLSRNVEGKYADAIELINASERDVVSVDIPSGIHANSGHVLGKAVKAFVTVTFSALKPGMVLYPGAEYCGKIIKGDVGSEPAAHIISQADRDGVNKEAKSDDLPAVFFLEKEDILEWLPVRIRRSNKGTYGRVLLCEGSDSMPGAALLSSKAAYMTGCGLGEVYTTLSAGNVILTQVPEAVLTIHSSTETQIADDLKKLAEALARAKAVCVGPGLSAGPFTEACVSMCLESEEKCVVADADALRTMCFIPCADRRHSPLIITPHPGEMAHLLGCSVSGILDDPLGCAVRFAGEHHLICVLKDAATVITDGEKICINRSGCDGMATAGAGDVLTGIIGSLLAQGMDPFRAACLGVYIHGLAGEEAMKEKGGRSMRAGDIAEHIADVLNGL